MPTNYDHKTRRLQTSTIRTQKRERTRAVLERGRGSGASIFLLRIDTRHFEFMAFGRTAEEAKDVMRRAWATHCQQTGAEDDLIEHDIEDATPLAITVPGAFRDWSAI